MLLLREWYMHPNGQIPAYEFAFGDVNPPVHAWACWRVYKMTGPRGKRDRLLPRARLPEAAAQLHLVGQPQGSRGPQPLRRRLSRPRQHRRLRPLQAAAHRRPSRAGRRHGMDGVLLQHHAVHGAGAGERGSRLRGRGLQVLRAFHRHRRRDESPGRHRASGTKRTVSTTISSISKASTSRCASARSSASCRSSRSKCSTRRRSATSRASSAG